MKTLVGLALGWPVVLVATVWARQGGQAPLWTVAVYAVGARICHQLPDRSFFTGGVQWPVCARCAGLYLSAPFGALIALVGRRPLARRSAWAIVLVAALPTLVT